MGKGWKKSRDDRAGGQFLALPHTVLNSAGYRSASHTARSLLIDIAQQFKGDNNGKLVACSKYLKPKGWNSESTITRAVHKLIEHGLLIETRKGARPNKAAWYALSWMTLHITEGLDIDPKRYQFGAYRQINGASLTPSGGVERGRIAPSQGVRAAPTTPSQGAMQ